MREHAWLVVLGNLETSICYSLLNNWRKTFIKNITNAFIQKLF